MAKKPVSTELCQEKTWDRISRRTAVCNRPVKGELPSGKKLCGIHLRKELGIAAKIREFADLEETVTRESADLLNEFARLNIDAHTTLGQLTITIERNSWDKLAQLLKKVK